MYHSARSLFCSASTRVTLLAALAIAGGSLGGCAPEAAPAPAPAPAAAPAAPAPAADPGETSSTYVAPGNLIVRWSFGDASLASACANRHVDRVRIEVGIGSPTIARCADGEARFPQTTAGMYSVGVSLMSATGEVADDRYEVVTVRSNDNTEALVAF